MGYKLTWSEIKERLKAPSPDFWKSISRYFLIIGGGCGTLLATPTNFPEWLKQALGVGVGLGAGGYIISLLTKHDSQTIDKMEVDKILQQQREAFEAQLKALQEQQKAIDKQHKLEE